MGKEGERKKKNVMENANHFHSSACRRDAARQHLVKHGNKRGTRASGCALFLAVVGCRTRRKQTGAPVPDMDGGGAMFYLKSFNHITPSNPGTHGTRRPGRLSPLNTVGPCVPGSVFISAPFLFGEGLGQAERPAYPVKLSGSAVRLAHGVAQGS